MKRHLLACAFGLSLLPAFTTLQAADVVSFTLIDATTNAAVPGYDPIPADATIDLGTIASRKINVRANTNAPVGSVMFRLTGAEKKIYTESVEPYSLCGDDDGDYKAWKVISGDYTLKAQSFSKKDAKGSAGKEATLNFRVILPEEAKKEPVSSKPEAKPAYPENPP